MDPINVPTTDDSSQPEDAGEYLRVRACQVWRSVVPKVSYIFNAATLSPILSFSVAFFYDQARIPRISSHIPPFVMFIGSPLWTVLADILQRRTLLWCLSIVLCSLAHMSWYWWPSNLWVLLALVSLAAFSRAPISPFHESCVIEKVGLEEYGKQRWWLSAAWGVIACTGGYGIDMYGFRVVFILSGVCTAFLLARMEPSAEAPKTCRPPTKDVPFLDKLRACLQWDVFTLLLRAFFLGAGQAQTQLFFMYLKQKFPTEKLFGLYGASVMCSIGLEIPTFFFSAFLLRKLGPELMMFLSQLAFVVRVVSYTLIRSPWWALPVEGLHGIMFGFFWAAIVTRISALFPKGLEATAQGVLAGIYLGLGFGVGFIAGGEVFRSMGGEVLFTGSAVIMGAVMIFSAANDVFLWLRRRNAAIRGEVLHEPLSEIVDMYDRVESESSLPISESPALDDAGASSERLPEPLGARVWRAVVPKAANIFYAGALSPILSFSRYDESQVGMLMAVIPFVMFVGAPLWTAMADRLRRRTLLWVVAIVVCIIAWFWGASNIWVLLVLVATAAFCRAPITPFLDACIIEKVGMDGYGKQRWWLSAAWGVIACTGGYGINRFGFGVIFLLSGVCAIFFVLFAILLSRMKPATEAPKSNRAAPRDVPFLVKLRACLQWDVFTLLFRAFFLGAGQAQTQLFFMYLKQKFASTENVYGLYGASVLCSIGLEIPTFFFSAFLLRKLGPELMMFTSQLAFVVRVMSYTLIPSPWWALPIEGLHGIMFGFFWAAAVSRISALFPKGLEATAQGALSGFYLGLGFGIGFIAGGAVFKYFGGDILFRGSAAIMVTVMFFCVLNDVFLWLKRRNAAMRGEVVHQELDELVELDEALKETPGSPGSPDEVPVRTR
eukprot:m51a1_g2748 hypothetical protein (890) ;mRNA; r:949841-953655